MANVATDASAGVLTRRYQRFVTEITDPKTGLTAGFAVYPSAPRIRTGSRGRRFPLQARPQRTGLMKIDGFSPRYFGSAGARHFDLLIAATLDPDLVKGRHVAHEISPPPDLHAFSEYLYKAPVLPFRRSPISGQSVAGLLARASGSGGGGALGAYVGLQHGLLLILTVPGGMIVGGTAMGVATALETGLHEKVLAMIVPPEDRPSSEESEAPGI